MPTTRTERKGGIAAIADEVSRLQVQTLDENCDDFGITEFKMNDVRQGIVHVVGPEQGATLPGMTVVCGDSHTSTHGAFGAGPRHRHFRGRACAGDQCLVAKKMKNMLVKVEGRLPAGVTAKDIVLAVIGRIGTAGGNGHAIEFAGSAIRDLSIEGRMTICNMSIEAGARVGLVAVDQKTIDYVKGPALRAERRAMGPGRRLLAGAGVGRRCPLRYRGRAGRRADQAAGQLGARRRKWSWPWTRTCRTRPRERPDRARFDRARLEIHGPAAEPGDHRHPAGPGIHRFLHQLADRGPACRRRSGQGPQGRRDHQAGVGGAGFRVGQEQAEKEGLDRIFIEAGFEWREPAVPCAWR